MVNRFQQTFFRAIFGERGILFKILFIQQVRCRNESRDGGKCFYWNISYIRVGNGFMYLTGIIDVYSRKILSYRLSNSLSTNSCVDAMEDATSKYGKPEIINSDQGSQYTSELWIKAVKDLDIRISMTGKGRSNDNAYIERFWRTAKYEWLKLKFIPNVEKLKIELKDFMKWYNNERPHQSLGYLTPDEKACGIMDKWKNLSTIPQAQQ